MSKTKDYFMDEEEKRLEFADKEYTAGFYQESEQLQDHLLLHQSFHSECLNCNLENKLLRNWKIANENKLKEELKIYV